jgi:hypothetical protein
MHGQGEMEKIIAESDRPKPRLFFHLLAMAADCTAGLSFRVLSPLNTFLPFWLFSFDYVGPILPRYMSNARLKSLGFKFKHSLEDMFKGAVECAVKKGLVAYPGTETP